MGTVTLRSTGTPTSRAISASASCSPCSASTRGCSPVASRLKILQRVTPAGLRPGRSGLWSAGRVAALFATAKDHRELLEPGRCSVVQPTLESAALLVGCLHEPAARRRQLLDLGLHFSAKPGVRGCELSGCGYPLGTSLGSSSTAGSWMRAATGWPWCSSTVVERPDPGSGRARARPSASTIGAQVGQPVTDLEGGDRRAPGTVLHG